MCRKTFPRLLLLCSIIIMMPGKRKPTTTTKQPNDINKRIICYSRPPPPHIFAYGKNSMSSCFLGIQIYTIEYELRQLWLSACAFYKCSLFEFHKLFIIFLFLNSISQSLFLRSCKPKNRLTISSTIFWLHWLV